MTQPPDGCRSEPASGNAHKHRSFPATHLSAVPSLATGTSARLPRADNDRVISLLARKQQIAAERGKSAEIPETWPLCDTHKIGRQQVVVVATHPHDRTLSCGGAIALMQAGGYDVRVLVVSDGTRSHPNSRQYPPLALQSLRERETIASMRVLGVSRSAVTFLGIKDGAVPAFGAPHFPRIKSICQMYFQQFVPDTIFLPWREDPDTDRRATWQIIKAAILGMGISPQTIECPLGDGRDLQLVSNSTQLSGWRLDIREMLDRKLQAIEAHRSQLGKVIDDDPASYCLSADKLVNFVRPWEIYLEEVA